MRPIGDGHSMASIGFVVQVVSAHSEDHAWTSAVLHGGVPSQLYQVVVAQHGSNVVSVLFDVLNDLDGSIELRVFGSPKL